MESQAIQGSNAQGLASLF